MKNTITKEILRVLAESEREVEGAMKNIQVVGKSMSNLGMDGGAGKINIALSKIEAALERVEDVLTQNLSEDMRGYAEGLYEEV